MLLELGFINETYLTRLTVQDLSKKQWLSQKGFCVNYRPDAIELKENSINPKI